MSSIRQNSLIFLATSLVAMPAVGALVLYKVTGNPYLRPLAVSKEIIAAIDRPIQAISIEVRVEYGVDRRVSPSKPKLRKLISETLSTHTDAFHFQFVDTSGDDIEITFVVGPNEYGPHPPSNVGKGILSALDALEYTQRDERKTR